MVRVLDAIPSRDQLEERHGALFRLLRQIGDQRHLHCEQIGDRLDGLEGRLDLFHDGKHRPRQQAAEVDAHVGQRDVEVVGIEARPADEARERDRAAVGDAIPRIPESERGAEAKALLEDIGRDVECEIRLDTRGRLEHRRIRDERRQVGGIESRGRAEVERQRRGELR